MIRVNRQPAYGILLAIVAVVILVTGYLLKPQRSPRESSTPAASGITAIQAEVDRLRQLAERARRRATSARFAAVASQASTHLVYAPALRRSGIAWGPAGSILLPSNGLPPPPSLSIQSSGGPLVARPSAWGAGAIFMLVGARGGSRLSPATLGPPDVLRPGAWIVDVGLGRTGQQQMRPGNFGGLSPVACGGARLQRVVTNLPLDESALGSGLFDLDGNLIGVVARCRSEIVAISSASVRAALAAAEDPVAGPFLRAGLVVEAIVPRWQPFVRPTLGLFVSDVWRDWPADRAGILPGDVILTVNGEPARTAADVSQALRQGGKLRVVLDRGGRRLVATLSAAAEAQADLPEVAVTDDRGVELESVGAGGDAEAAGLMAGDRILRLNGAQATARAVQALFSASKPSKPAIVEVERGSRRFVTVVAK